MPRTYKRKKPIRSPAAGEGILGAYPDLDTSKIRLWGDEDARQIMSIGTWRFFRYRMPGVKLFYKNFLRAGTVEEATDLLTTFFKEPPALVEMVYPAHLTRKDKAA